MDELIRQGGAFPPGYTPICALDGRHAEVGVDFGILRLAAGRRHDLAAGKERAIVILAGGASLAWAGHEAVASRASVFDQSPWCLHLPAETPATITASGAGAELAIAAAANDRSFAPRMYSPADCRADERGKGTMRETSTRIVRAVIDDSTAPRANLVIGEAVTYPGKWSSYPPHHHPQPEIYHYRLLPEHGFGLAALGDQACQVHHLDTLVIPPGRDHPQVAAPGYAMYYLWVIRHLEGDRYGTPEFTPEHAWVQDPRARIWP